MPSAPAPTPANDPLRSVVEKGVQFHLSTGGKKWKCTILDRATHERQKATRTDSSSSLSSNDSETSSTISK
ncbi:hypothetical protein QBC34DRAFT_375582 [Podospora aff. communis PSN243]|uniref:Uncharacterized protein n=1 Tax=Podospora aff. communis PSN243 TaxID=3040156 RepID=A0AAV9H428_9PEZI|nr:hypothetical protein QBC34DRAFT_375582 [Podospora aff. communis PSN243]